MVSNLLFIWLAPQDQSLLARVAAIGLDNVAGRRSMMAVATGSFVRSDVPRDGQRQAPDEERERGS